MENKKVTLANGNVLEVGKKYRGEGYSPTEWQEVISIYGDKVLMKDEKGEYDLEYTYYDWLPYTPPTPQKEWKTFLIETLSQKTDVPYRFFSQYYSMEDAREHHKRAISIIEVKLNIEPVNS